MIGRISENLSRINGNIEALRLSLNISHPVHLIAVSKLQASELIMEAYNCGHRDFGENYVDELCTKALSLPEDIQWHMIGHLQSNKCKKLLKIKNLAAIHTIDSASLASTINNILQKDSMSLNAFIQVNTSAETTKAGVSVSEAIELGRFIMQQCKNLKLKGFMMIGEPGNVEDFVRLRETREMFEKSIGGEDGGFELSMGMSGDYEEAVRNGSNYVRVGTGVFGERIKHV